MSRIDGKCANCGSIIRIDSKSDKSRCPFCWAETENSLAESLYENDTDHKYLNEEYNQPSDEERYNLLRGQTGQTKTTSQKRTSTVVQPRKKKSEGPSAVDRVKAMNKAIVRVPKVPAKKWFIVLGVPVLLLALFLGISLPTYFSRLNKRVDLQEQIKKRSEFKIEKDSSFAIDGLNNEYLLLVLNEDIDKDLAEDLAKMYQELHSKVYGRDSETDTVKVQILSRLHSYEVKLNGSDIKVVELKDTETVKQSKVSEDIRNEETTTIDPSNNDSELTSGTISENSTLNESSK